ncbi:MAG: hypothetical protein BroJett038_08640 [Chloroflexota bacterium]|nr:MAG: hypothetical protein BroJett038_08640 [Chloroflexota bacterium]
MLSRFPLSRLERAPVNQHKNDAADNPQRGQGDHQPRQKKSRQPLSEYNPAEQPKHRKTDGQDDAGL